MAATVQTAPEQDVSTAATAKTTATTRTAATPTKSRLTCPRCDSTDVSRSQRVDWQEKAFCWFRRVLPYRCRKCDIRFYGRKLAG